MKKLITLLISFIWLTACATPPNGDWIAVPESDDDHDDDITILISSSQIFTDPTNPNRYTAIVLGQIENSDVAKSALPEVVVDCKNASFALRHVAAYTDYYAKGDIVNKMTMDSLEFKELDPASVDDNFLFEMVCNK